LSTRLRSTKTPYNEEQHNLDQQISLADLEYLEAHEDEIDVEGALNFSEYVLSNAGRLWVESDLSGKQRLQQALFPRGVTFDNSSLQPPSQAAFSMRSRMLWH